MSLLYRLRRKRGLLRLLALDSLASALREKCGDPFLKARIASELVLRAWLLGGGQPWCRRREKKVVCESLLQYGLDLPGIERLEAWLGEQHLQRTFTLPEQLAHDLGVRLCKMVRHDLANWRESDGVLIFVTTKHEEHIAREVVLPYVVERESRGHKALVRTANDLPVQSLSTGVERANGAAKRMGFLDARLYPAVVLVTLDGETSIPLEGLSTGLPVLITEFLQGKTRRLPSPLELAASGVLSPGGHLDAHAHDPSEIKRKVAALRDVGASMILMPACGLENGNASFWPCSEPLEAYLDSLLETPSCKQSIQADIETALERIGSGMCYGKIAPAHAKASLGVLLGQLEDREDIRGIRQRARANILLAAAESHLGNMEKSSSICEKLLAQRDKLGARFAASAFIHQAVSLTDMADYENAAGLCYQALELAMEIGDERENTDIQLRAQGTLGQALMYWGLIDPDQAPNALTALEQAIDLAVKFDSMELEDPDLPRNLTYRYLWHALHDPSGEPKAFEEVDVDVPSDDNSRQYLLKARWLAAYRAFLKGDPYNWQCFEEQIPRAKCEGGWVSKCALKYRGALRASVGDFKAAEEDFVLSASLTESMEYSPLLAFIGATAALQAGESLLEHNPEKAEVFLQQALEVFGKCADWFPLHPEIQGVRWIERSQGLMGRRPVAELPNPQLYYPY